MTRPIQILILALSLGAAVSLADTVVPTAAAPVVVSILSATLAEDCAPTASNEKPDPEAKRAPRACRQTSVQLAVASDAQAGTSALTIEKAQLFDAAGGAPLQTLTPRNPQLWSASAGRYVRWDSVVKPSQKLQVTFDLNAPDWSKLGNRSKSFRLELTVRVAGRVAKIGTTVRSAELVRESDVDT